MIGIEIKYLEPFEKWYGSLKDKKTRLRIIQRIRRLEAGQYGDSKNLGGALYELRLDFGPGYRVYYARRGLQIIVVLMGGDKGSQAHDIERARQFLKNMK